MNTFESTPKSFNANAGSKYTEPSRMPFTGGRLSTVWPTAGAADSHPTAHRTAIPISDIAYIELQQFTDLAVEELAAALEAVAGQGYEGLILDLRRNPGGSLGATVEIADMFLGDGIILTQVNQDGSEKVFEAKPGGEATDILLVVLGTCDTPCRMRKS